MTTVIISGLLLGLAAGFSPGVLLTLVISQTLRHGVREGCKVALAPLVSDTPIILLALFSAARLAAFQSALGMVSIVGGVFTLYLAAESFRPVNPDAEALERQPDSLRKGILVNLLNPNPWLFWFTVGVASLTNALATGWPAAAAFLALFYLGLVGGKMIVAILTARSRAFLSGTAYRIVMGLLGLLLAGYAFLLVRDGLNCLR